MLELQHAVTGLKCVEAIAIFEGHGDGLWRVCLRPWPVYELERTMKYRPKSFRTLGPLDSLLHYSESRVYCIAALDAHREHCTSRCFIILSYKKAQLC